MDIREAHKFCPYCGTGYDSYDGPALKCSNCERTLYLNHSFTVGVLCITVNGEIVMVERKRDPGKGSLDLPAGFIDLTDVTIEEAAAREMQEELGIEIDTSKLVYLTSVAGSYLHHDIEEPIMTAYFTYPLPADSQMHAGDDAGKVYLFKINDIPQDRIYFAHTKAVLATYKNSILN